MKMLLPEIVQPGLTSRNITPDQVSVEYVGWLVNPEINQFLEVRHEEVTLESQKQFIEDINSSYRSSIFGVLLNHKSIVGTIKVGPINIIHKTAHIGILIGSREHHGKGIATNAIGALAGLIEVSFLTT